MTQEQSHGTDMMKIMEYGNVIIYVEGRVATVARSLEKEGVPRR